MIGWKQLKIKMLDFLKQMNELRAMQARLKNEVVTVEEAGVKLVMRGDMQLQEVKIPQGLETERLETILKELHTRAMTEIQTRLSQSLTLPH
ncbi:MAG: YbaB/EbfC family nucleoid-associated protein [Patescibacteria group bacterium]|nr:YbaB/EbfC family nucleoid-associated protein [Patescibacteria group bacterium]